VVFSVSDTGQGMAPEVIERAFDPFFTTKGVGKGTGLGLSQVFGFVKQSGGHVKIYSEVGQGTTVKVYLPRFAGEGPVAAPRLALAPLPAGRADEVVLVVEDDDRVRRMSVDALRELGYTVVHASTPGEALRQFQARETVALVFTDIVMPEMTGRQMVEAMREHAPTLSALYTTGYTRNAVVHQGVLDSGIDLLPKPFTLEQLAAKVRRAIDSAQASIARSPETSPSPPH
jgi:CheY-like chemotaxis protein